MKSIRVSLSGVAFVQLRFLFHCKTPVVFRQWPGAAVKSAVGAVMKQLTCLSGRAPCVAPPCKRGCAYAYLFETASADPSVPYAPGGQVARPFVITSPERFEYCAGERLAFDVSLFGKAVEYVPQMVCALQMLEERRLGSSENGGAGQVRLEQVTAVAPDRSETRIYDGWRQIYTPVSIGTTLASMLPPSNRKYGSIRLSLETPTRLVDNGRVVTREIHFSQIVRAALRRLSSVLHFHGGREPGLPARELIDAAGAVQITRDALRWDDQQRYSVRQRQSISMSGFRGEFTFSGNVAPFIDLLEVCRHLHIGKGAVTGLGRYDVHYSPAPNRARRHDRYVSAG